MTLDDLFRWLTPIALLVSAASFAAVHYKATGRKYAEELSERNAKLNAENREAMEARIATLEHEKDDCQARLLAQDNKLASQDQAMAILREQVTQVAAVDRLAATMDGYYHDLLRQLRDSQ